MKLSPRLLAALAGAYLCVAPPALAQSPASWLSLLNAEPGRAQKLTAEQVVFRPSVSPSYPGLVSVGFPQSDGTLTLGSLIWQGKVYSPLAGYAGILQQQGFAEASDEERASMFLDVLTQCNASLGLHPYQGAKSRQRDRPQPIFGQRQPSGGQHSFVVWMCEEPGNREGPEWREMLYQVSPDAAKVRARTLNVYHPAAERLRDFPPMPSESSE